MLQFAHFRTSFLHCWSSGRYCYCLSVLPQFLMCQAKNKTLYKASRRQSQTDLVKISVSSPEPFGFCFTLFSADCAHTYTKGWSLCCDKLSILFQTEILEHHFLKCTVIIEDKELSYPVCQWSLWSQRFWAQEHGHGIFSNKRNLRLW